MYAVYTLHVHIWTYHILMNRYSLMKHNYPKTRYDCRFTDCTRCGKRKYRPSLFKGRCEQCWEDIYLERVGRTDAVSIADYKGRQKAKLKEDVMKWLLAGRDIELDNERGIPEMVNLFKKG